MFEHLKKYPLFGVTLPTDSGIYAIVNKVNGEFYIGSTKNQFGFRGRFNVHRYKFRTKTHTQKLNQVYEEYGPDNLEVWIVLLCPYEECHEYEQLFINLLEPHYNGVKTVRSWTGFKHTPETCNIIREKALMRGARSDATKKKLSDVKGQYFEIYHEVEGLITGVNLKTFEKNRGLSRGSLGHVISGNTIRCKGFFKDKETCENWWKAKQLREEEKIKKKSKPRKPPSQHRQKEFSLYKVGTGTIYATNVRAFARENELDYRALYKILDGRAIEHKGYYKDEESYFKSISKILNQASVHKGVTFNKNENKWRTNVYLPEIKKQIFVGQYRTEQEAANAAYEARIFYGLEIS